MQKEGAVIPIGYQDKLKMVFYFDSRHIEKGQEGLFSLTKKKYCLYKNRNQFIGTQDDTYNLGSSRYLAGLIAHEGTHWKQKQGVRNFDKIQWQ